MVQPDKKRKLNGEVERDPLRDKGESVLNDAHSAEKNPISQPLGIISGHAAIDSLEGCIGRIYEGDQVRYEFQTSNSVGKSAQGEDNEQEEVNLGISGLCLDFLQLF